MQIHERSKQATITAEGVRLSIIKPRYITQNIMLVFSFMIIIIMIIIMKHINDEYHTNMMNSLTVSEGRWRRARAHRERAPLFWLKMVNGGILVRLMGIIPPSSNPSITSARARRWRASTHRRTGTRLSKPAARSRDRQWRHPSILGTESDVIWGRPDTSI